VNPETEIEDAFPYLDELDNVIVMTLQRTGWAGQPFQESSLVKIEAVRKEIDRRGLSVDVVVDGGIDEQSGRRCIAAGATVIAAASSMFRAGDPAQAAQRLRAAADAGKA
jgi:ribulose-phosphate 3-epimerase